MEKRPLPVTCCTVCGTVGYTIERANTQCGKRFNGKRCKWNWSIARARAVRQGFCVEDYFQVPYETLAKVGHVGHAANALFILSGRLDPA